MHSLPQDNASGKDGNQTCSKWLEFSHGSTLYKKKNKEGETVTFRCREIYHGSAALLDLKIHKHMTRRVTRFKTKKEKCKLLTIVS